MAPIWLAWASEAAASCSSHKPVSSGPPAGSIRSFVEEVSEKAMGVSWMAEAERPPAMEAEAVEAAVAEAVEVVAAAVVAEAAAVEAEAEAAVAAVEAAAAVSADASALAWNSCAKIILEGCRSFALR